MKISVLGAGAWGTALAVAAAARHDVWLWSRSTTHCELCTPALQRLRLADVGAPDAHVSTHAACWPCRAGLRDRPRCGLRGHGRAGRRSPGVVAVQGLRSRIGALGHEIAAAVRPVRPAGFCRPSFASRSRSAIRLWSRPTMRLWCDRREAFSATRLRHSRRSGRRVRGA